jgi:hypothetical protein
VGLNYLPSTAVNDVEMWQAETFDAATIARELAWAAGLGLNSCRVFLNYVVWEADAAGLKERLAAFLDIAAGHGITVMPILFDDCAFGGAEPAVGPQGDPVPGVHNSRWVPSPGSRRLRDSIAWAGLEAYVRDLVGDFADDPRVAAWDLYNEPGNGGMAEAGSLALVEAALSWARDAGPSQPLTVGVWHADLAELNRAQLDLSDVISFHNYGDVAAVRAQIADLARLGRPMLCTEWLARTTGSRFETHLPVFRAEGVGCYCWGLVAGRTQTYYPWGSPEGAPEPQLWHHDILRPDGSPFDPAEVETIRRWTKG